MSLELEITGSILILERKSRFVIDMPNNWPVSLLAATFYWGLLQKPLGCHTDTFCYGTNFQTIPQAFHIQPFSGII